MATRNEGQLRDLSPQFTVHHRDSVMYHRGYGRFSGRLLRVLWGHHGKQVYAHDCK